MPADLLEHDLSGALGNGPVGQFTRLKLPDDDLLVDGASACRIEDHVAVGPNVKCTPATLMRLGPVPSPLLHEAHGNHGCR